MNLPTFKFPHHFYISSENKKRTESGSISTSQKRRQSERLKNDVFYQECKKVSPELVEKVFYNKRDLGPITSSCRAPSTYGLQNSDQIIPNYYFKEKDLEGQVLEHDFYFSILDSIRNMRVLSKYQIEYIKELKKEDYCELLNEYNKIMIFMVDYVKAIEGEP